MRVLAITCVVAAAVCTPQFSAHAQFITLQRSHQTYVDSSRTYKITKFGSVPRFALYGVGGVATGEGNEADFASARFAVEWNPFYKTFIVNRSSDWGYDYFTRLTVGLSFNKGAGLDLMESSTGGGQMLTRRPLIFPEASNTAFLLSLEATPVTVYQDRGTSFIDIGKPFFEYAWQSYSTNGISDINSFDAETQNIGMRIISLSSKTSGLRISVTASSFWSRLSISDAGISAYRELYSDPRLDESFEGWGTRISADLNNFIVEFEHKDLKATDGMTGDGIIGGQYTIKTAIKGLIFSEKGD